MRGHLGGSIDTCALADDVKQRGNTFHRASGDRLAVERGPVVVSSFVLLVDALAILVQKPHRGCRVQLIEGQREAGGAGDEEDIFCAQWKASGSECRR